MSDEMSGVSASVPTVVILGAGGYLGSSLCRFYCSLPSYHVVAIFRGEPSHRSFSRHVVADAFIDDWSTKIAMSGPMVLINCAFDFKAVGSGGYERKYALFERNIAALSRVPLARLINISTMSAYPGCRTDYGREKLFVENLFRKFGGVNVRPGMIASWRRPGAAILNLIGIVKASKVIPTLAARGSGFYFCDLEAVVLGIYLLTSARLNKPHTLSFCYRDRLSLRATLRLIESRYGIRRIKVPVPWRIAYLMLLVKEALMGKSKVRADSVLDFAYPAKTVSGREMFARMIAFFRSDLEALPRAVGAPGDFYFLEGLGISPALRRPCRATAAVESGVIASLCRLADA